MAQRPDVTGETIASSKRSVQNCTVAGPDFQIRSPLTVWLGGHYCQSWVDRYVDILFLPGCGIPLFDVGPVPKLP